MRLDLAVDEEASQAGDCSKQRDEPLDARPYRDQNDAADETDDGQNKGEDLRPRFHRLPVPRLVLRQSHDPLGTVGHCLVVLI